MTKLRALIVDDCPQIRELLMWNLRQTRMADFEFVEAEDGADAVTKFDPATIHVCFIDWNMPGINGVEFIRKVRCRGGADHVPMVIVTGEHTLGKIDQALEATEADAYVCKPFTVADLKIKLERIMNRLTAPRGVRGLVARLFQRAPASDSVA